jgi:signal transduction histidine kinase
MEEMINTLLDFARARSGTAIPLSPAPTDLGEIVRETVEELRSAWPRREVEVVVHGDARGEWDGPRIAQVTSNLVANALIHGAVETPVQVMVSDEGAWVDVSVHNAGPPIPPELMPVLFEPFRRGAEEARAGGLGLGLYIAHQIVAAHGGSIEVRSTASEGTRFTLHLPRSPVPATRTEPLAQPPG